MKKLFAALCTLLFGIYNSHAAGVYKTHTVSASTVIECKTNTSVCINSAVSYVGCSNPKYTSSATANDPNGDWTFIVYCATSIADNCSCPDNEFFDSYKIGWKPGSGVIVCNAQLCKPCSECTGTSGAWSDVSGQNYSKRSVYGCSGGRCLQGTLQYGCNADYYGEFTLTPPPDCTLCPTMKDTDGVTQPGRSNRGTNESITGCFITPPTVYLDDTGTFNLTGQCFYSL